jgi:hypothetical protein
MGIAEMWRKLVILLACLIVLAFAAPFLRDTWAWHKIRTNYPLDATERAALKNWQGSPESFVEMLRGHCLQSHGNNPDACSQYQ